MTTTSVIPTLRAALVTQAAAALPDCIVRYGYGISDDPEFTVLMVGATDPFGESADEVATSQQDWVTVGQEKARTEEGFISCIAMCANGNEGEAALQEAVEGCFAITETVETMLRATPALGVPSVTWTSYGVQTGLRDLQDEDGTVAYVVFQVAFRAYLT